MSIYYAIDRIAVDVITAAAVEDDGDDDNVSHFYSSNTVAQ